MTNLSADIKIVRRSVYACRHCENSAHNVEAIQHAPGCPLYPKPTLDQDIERIVAVFEFIRNDRIYPHGCTAEQMKQLDADSKMLSDIYHEFEPVKGWPEADRISRKRFIKWVLTGCPEKKDAQ